MEDNSHVTVTSTLSLGTLGFITWLVFLILKLTGVITFSWFWVWFPLWIVPAVEIGLTILLVPIILIFTRDKY